MPEIPGQAKPYIVTNMLKVIDLHKSFGKGFFKGPGTQAVKGVSFELSRGKTMGIVGESGSGKSTLARLLPGLLPGDKGQIELDGFNITRLKGGELNRIRRKIQIIFQHPLSSFNPGHLLGKSLAEPLVIVGKKKEATRKTLTGLLAKADLGEDILDRYPHQVSGGELQRVALARALALEPDYLILDEPTAMLDVSTQARMLHMLKGIQARFNTGFIFITHDLDVAAFMGDQIAVMHQGRFIEQGETDQIMNTPGTAVTKRLIHYFREFDAK